MPLTTYEDCLGRARFRLIPGLGTIPVRKVTADTDLVYRPRRENTLAASTIRQIVIQDRR
ncbi:MAG: hypothetical protein M3450_02310 [Actinomycetota bacterium]|nr:hypothetical protein [Actinomycetota bacterium]